MACMASEAQPMPYTHLDSPCPSLRVSWKALDSDSRIHNLPPHICQVLKW